MKKFKAKTIAALLTAVILLAVLPDANTMEAKAAAPMTYAVKYNPSDKTWYYQAGTNSFDEKNNNNTRSVYYLKTQELQDGDIVVVLNDEKKPEPLDLGNAHLSNLTIRCKPENFTIVYTGGIDYLYVLEGSSCSVNGNVVSAHISDPSTVNINGDVSELIIDNIKDNPPKSYLSCSGTVGHLYAPSTTNPRTYINKYDFKKGTLEVSKGSLKTGSWAYSDTPSQAAYGEAQLSQAQATASGGYTYDGVDYSLVFDAGFYARKYPDLSKAYGTDSAALLQHFVTCGMKEGRQGAKTFDPAVYKKNYKDLQNAFKDNWTAYYLHYINIGHAEGRTAY